MSKYMNEWAAKRWTRKRRARFHARYIRSVSSNIIHRSMKDGLVQWGVDPKSGAKVIRYWYVRPICPLGKFSNPHLLTMQDVLKAESIEVSLPNAPTEIVLCKDCFPTGSGKHTPLRKAVPVSE